MYMMIYSTIIDERDMFGMGLVLWLLCLFVTAIGVFLEREDKDG
jgi:hypothetical protein